MINENYRRGNMLSKMRENRLLSLYSHSNVNGNCIEYKILVREFGVKCLITYTRAYWERESIELALHEGTN